MELSKIQENEKLTVAVSGRVDTVTAPELEKFIMDNIDGVKELIIDVKDMAYISSAGLRVILKAHKTMSPNGTMIIVNVQSDVMDIFEITGFSDILTIG